MILGSLVQFCTILCCIFVKNMNIINNFYVVILTTNTAKSFINLTIFLVITCLLFNRLHDILVMFLSLFSLYCLLFDNT